MSARCAFHIRLVEHGHWHRVYSSDPDLLEAGYRDRIDAYLKQRTVRRLVITPGEPLALEAGCYLHVQFAATGEVRLVPAHEVLTRQGVYSSAFKCFRETQSRPSLDRLSLVLGAVKEHTLFFDAPGQKKDLARFNRPPRAQSAPLERKLSLRGWTRGLDALRLFDIKGLLARRN